MYFAADNLRACTLIKPAMTFCVSPFETRVNDYSLFVYILKSIQVSRKQSQVDMTSLFGVEPWAVCSLGTQMSGHRCQWGDVKPGGSQNGSQAESAFSDKELAPAHIKCQLSVGLIFKVTRRQLAKYLFRGQAWTALDTVTITMGS